MGGVGTKEAVAAVANKGVIAATEKGVDGTATKEVIHMTKTTGDSLGDPMGMYNKVLKDVTGGDETEEVIQPTESEIDSTGDSMEMHKKDLKEVTDGTQIKEFIQMTKNGFDSMNEAMGMLNDVLDKNVSWQKYEKTLKSMDYYPNDYSKESGQLVSEMKVLMTDAHDSYKNSTQCIYEWCSMAKQLLYNYQKVLEKRPSNACEQLRGLLIQVLDCATKKMTAGQVNFEQSIVRSNNAAGKLASLHTQLTKEFNSESSYFQSMVYRIRKDSNAGVIKGPFGLTINYYDIADGNVEKKLISELRHRLNGIIFMFNYFMLCINNSNSDIDDTNVDLRNIVKKIGQLKTQTEATNTLIPIADLDALRDSVLPPVTELIVRCDKYQRRHKGED